MNPRLALTVCGAGAEPLPEPQALPWNQERIVVACALWGPYKPSVQHKPGTPSAKSSLVLW